MTTADAFFADAPTDFPDEIPRDQWRRPLIAPPGRRGVDCARDELTGYTRASGLGACLENETGLVKWKLNMTVFGMSRRVDLQDAATAVATCTEPADKKRLGEIAEQAREAAASSAGATRGTALHLLSERADAGEDLSYLPQRLQDAVAAWRRLMGAFDIIATETFVVNDELEAAGTFDRLAAPRGWMTAPDGTVIGPDDALILDLKSGKDPKHFGPKYTVQQAIYAGGVRYSHADGRQGWSELIGPDQRPHQGWALIPHVPVDAPERAGLFWVDLAEGRELAQLARAVKRAQSSKGLPPAALPSPEAPRGALVPLIAAALSRDELVELYRANLAVWTPDLDAQVRARLAELAVAA